MFRSLQKKRYSDIQSLKLVVQPVLNIKLDSVICLLSDIKKKIVPNGTIYYFNLRETESNGYLATWNNIYPQR